MSFREVFERWTRNGRPQSIGPETFTFRSFALDGTLVHEMQVAVDAKAFGYDFITFDLSKMSVQPGDVLVMQEPAILRNTPPDSRGRES